MIYEDSCTISLFEQFDKIENEKHEETKKELDEAKKAIRLHVYKKDGTNEDYINEMLNIEDCYDLRNDELLANGDVIGKCMFCGKNIDVEDVCKINALSYTYYDHFGKKFIAFACFGTCSNNSQEAFDKAHESLISSRE